MSSARAVPDPKNQSNNNNYINRNSPCSVNLGRSPNENYYNSFMKRTVPRKSVDRSGSPSLSGYPSVCTGICLTFHSFLTISFIHNRLFEGVRLITMDHLHRMATFPMISMTFTNTKPIINILHTPVITINPSHLTEPLWIQMFIVIISFIEHQLLDLSTNIIHTISMLATIRPVSIIRRSFAVWMIRTTA